MLTTLTRMPFGGLEFRSFLKNVFNFPGPPQALTAWYEDFVPVVEKHAPIRKRRIQHPTFPQFLKPDIISVMKIRDKLKHEKKFGH